MLKGKEKQAVDELLKKYYSAYYTSLYRFCLSRLKNNSEVDDVTQEAFIVLYNKMLNGETIEKVYPFLLKTADNLIKRIFKERTKNSKNVTLEEVKHIPSQNEDIDDRLTFEEYSKQISEALSDRDAELFSLRYIEELKIEEIASITGLSIPNVTTRLSRIRKKLRETLSEEYFKI
ncbi:MAG: RNA polymerase sigma factor [Eubacterium sp.]|nr:RNA polymerase sigma factor [Eubacterium sp.]